ncbi:hypothetical protein N7541_001863 [Penicillium brevicompactum]|uniref:Leucine-rich repeat domain-containing protein n=1 Tax=Penicillium brevicompactum TaxID=5074 RepID=A0A9W9RKN1_PENBR|nr:hypothetical protein N7541_001863 [Penicillium brevicompactum]
MSLNSDIWLLVYENLYQRDKLNLLLVCRDWYSLFFTKVYQTISVKALQIPPLARSVRHNPGIGTAIQNLRLRWYPNSRTQHEYEVDTLVDVLKQASDSEDVTKWNKALQKGCPDAWLAVLVLSLESLRSLTLNYSYSPYFVPLIARVADGKVPSIPVLQHLQRVTVEVDDMKAYYLTHELIPFLRLPVMRVFTAIGVCEDEPDVLSPKPGASSVTKLEFGAVDTNNGAREFASWITSCAALEVFSYQHDNKAIWGEVYLDFRPLLFYNALCSQKQSLRKLRLNNNGDTGDTGCDDESEHFKGFGSLVEFHQLRELHAPLRTLLQFGSSDSPKVSLLEVLPTGLEILGLGDCREEDFKIAIKNLQGLLAQRERYPHISRIQVQPDHSQMMEAALQYFNPFEMACQKIGIVFYLCMYG